MRLLYCFVEFKNRKGKEKPLRGMKELELNFSTTDVYRFERGCDGVPDILRCSRRDTPLPEQFWANGADMTNIYNINVITGMNGAGKTTAIHYLIDLLNYIYHGFGQTLSEQDRRVRHDPSKYRNLILFDTEDGLCILDLHQKNQTRQGLHMEDFSEPPRFLNKAGAEELLQKMKVVYLTNTLTQRDYELHVGTDENERLWNNFIFDGTLGASIGPEVGKFFTYEVYKQVKYLFDPIQFEKRKELEITIPELRLPRALRLRPLVKPFKKELGKYTGQESGRANADSFSRLSLPVQLALLCAASYVENMISLLGLKLYIFPQFLRLPTSTSPDGKNINLDDLTRFISLVSNWCNKQLSTIIISGSSDSSLRVWDATSGECQKILRGHEKQISCAAVLPDWRVVSGSDDRTLRVWNITSGKCQIILKGHEGPIRCVAILNDGRVVSGSDDHTLRVWDTASGECQQILKGHRDDVSCVAVLPDGRVVSGSWDNTLRVWDADSGECQKTMEGHIGGVSCVAVLPDGQVVSGSGDSTLRVWDVARGECQQILKGYKDYISCVAVLPDGRVVSGSDGGTLRVWDAESGECQIILKGHTSYIHCVAVLPDGRVVSGSWDNTLRVWDAARGDCQLTLEGHEGPIYSVSILPGGWVESSVKEVISERADNCHDYIKYVLNDPDKLFSKFEQPDRDENIYELPIPQDNIKAIKRVEKSLVKFLKKYHIICTPYYTLDFDWGLSSGEENMLRLFSWLFHIFPRTAADGGARYSILNNPEHKYNSGNECDSVLLIMDEADLTFHPEWQRRLIHILTAFLPEIYPPRCAKDLQLVLTTHSPLLLGDVPRENIHYLHRVEDSTLVQVDNDSETFGQNIHTILKDSFFLEKGTVGEFAAKKIDGVAYRLNRILNENETTSDSKEYKIQEDLSEIRQIIDLVAPGLIRAKLESMLLEVERKIGQQSGSEEAQRQWDSIKKLSPSDQRFLLRKLADRGEKQ